VRPPGFRRDVRPLHDLAALGPWFATYTGAKIFITFAGPALVWAGVASLIHGQGGGVLICLLGVCIMLGLAWGNYYRYPDPDRADVIGKHQ
jgi:hypothetical protein